METFEKKLELLFLSAKIYIQEKVNKAPNQVINFIPNNEINSDEFWETPNHWYVSKHGFYVELGVIQIRKENEVYLAVIVEKGEGEEENDVFKLDDFYNDTIISIASKIQKGEIF